MILNNFSKFSDLSNPNDNIYTNFQGGAFPNCSIIGAYCFTNTQIQSIDDSTEAPTNLWGSENEDLSCLNIGYSSNITELKLNNGVF